MTEHFLAGHENRCSDIMRIGTNLVRRQPERIRRTSPPESSSLVGRPQRRQNPLVAWLARSAIDGEPETPSEEGSKEDELTRSWLIAESAYKIRQSPEYQQMMSKR